MTQKAEHCKKLTVTATSDAHSPICRQASNYYEDMKNNPLISIVVCTHNRANLIGQTMETIFAQEYRPVEILVVDDGSTDNTPELMKSYGDAIRYYRHDNKGIAATRTIACKLAKGEYIAFQDDDDLMLPDRITVLLEALRKYPEAVFAMGDWTVIDPEGSLTDQKSYIDLEVKDGQPVLVEDAYSAVLWPKLVPVPHNTLFRKADGERIGWFDAARFFRGCSDMDFYARLGKLGPIVYVPKVVSYYRRGHAQIWDNKLAGEYSFFLLLEKHLMGLDRENADLRKRLQKWLLGILMTITFLQGTGANVPEGAPQDYLERGLSHLNHIDRLKYWWYALVRFPVRRLIKGDH